MRIRYSQRHFYLFFTVTLLFLLVLASCGVKRDVRDKGILPDGVEVSYRKIILNAFEAEESLSKSSPGIAAICENAVLQELLDIGTAPMIMKTSARLLKEENTLIVRVRLAMTHAAPKTSTKSLQQKTKLTAQVRLLDASTGKTLSEENIFATDSAKNAAAGNPKELGISVARHIDRFIRKP
jgi:hypothetical protein